MSFAFAAPLALLLGALIAGPILAHLSQRRPEQRQAFGAMLLLRRLVKRLEKRRRIRELLLLLLRVLAVLAMVLAVARPELRVPGASPEFGGKGPVVLVLDDSMSMAQTSGGRTLMARARKDALDVLGDLPPGTPVGLVTLGGRAQSLSAEMSTDHAQIRAAIEATDAGYGRTDLVGGLHQARALLGGLPGEVLVFTDQAGPGVVEASQVEIQALVDRGGAVIPRVVQAKPPVNVVPLSATYGDGLEGGSVRVELANFGPEEVEVPVTLELPDRSEITAFTTVPAEGRTSEVFTVPLTVPGGVAAVQVDDPGLALDDRRSFHLPRVGASRVLVVDGDPGRTPFESEVYFLERALAPWGGVSGGLVPEVVSPAGLRRLEQDTHQVVFLANVEDVGPFAGTLQEFVQEGGSVVISVGKNVSAQRYNQTLSGLLPAPLRKPVDLAQADGVRLQTPDTSLPLFEPFARGGAAGFTQMRAFRVFTLEPFQESDTLRVLLRWEDGNPALVERRVGQGRVLLWTTSIDYDDNWSHAAVEAVFMPFIQRLVRTLGASGEGVALRAEGFVDEPIQLELPPGALEPQVTGPDGQRVESRLQRGAQTLLSFTPTLPGAHEIGQPEQPPIAQVAVNVAPEESDVRVSASIAEVERQADPELLTRSIVLGPWMLWLAFAALLGQAALSARPQADLEDA